MIGGSINNALAVKNNESNIQDSLDWIQQQRIHKMKLKQFKRDLMDQKVRVAQSKFGGKKYIEIDSQMALRNQNLRVTSLAKQNQDKKENMRKNLILSNKIKQIFTRRQSNYGELHIGSSSKLLSASPTTTKGHDNSSSLKRIKQHAGVNRHIMLNQSSGVELNEHQPKMKISDGNGQQHQMMKVEEPSDDDVKKRQLLQNPSFDGSSGHLIATSAQKDPKAQQQQNFAQTEQVQKQSKSELLKKGDQPATEKLVNDYDSQEKPQHQVFFGADHRKNNLTALTPMYLTNNQKADGDINSMETDLNQFGFKNHKDLLMTHQAAFNSGKKNNMGSTTFDVSGKINKMQANFNKDANSNMIKTQTSFQSQTTYPHLYHEVQRPSILHALNSGGKVGEQSEQTYFNILNSGLTSKMSVKQPFHNRHKSLNETIRKHEQMRITQENNKIFSFMRQLRPSSALQVEKLAKHHKKNQNLKKNIVMTKYSKRHQTQLKQAIRIRQKVFDDLPPVISPLYRAGLPRRRSSELAIKQMNKTVNALIKFNDSSQKIPSDLPPPPQGSVTARPAPIGGVEVSLEDAEKSGEMNDKQLNENPKMLMNHDESVQNVLYNTTTGFRQRHQSLGPATRQRQLDDLSPEQYYVQEEMKYLQQVDPQQYNNPYNFRMDIYSQQQDYKMSKHLYKQLGHSKYHKDLDLQEFTSGQLPTYTIDPALTPHMLQNYYSSKKVTNQDLNRRRFYGNLINQVSTRNIMPKTSLNYQTSGKNVFQAGSNSNQLITQSNFNRSSKSINNEQNQSQSNEPPEIVSGNLAPSAAASLAPKQSSNRQNFSPGKMKTIGYNLPSITNTYGLYQQLMSEEIDELKRIQEQQKLEGFRLKQQAIMKKERKRLDDIKKYKIALKQREKDQKLAQVVEAAGLDAKSSGTNVKVVDQNEIKERLQEKKRQSKSPPRIPNKTTISWVNKMRTAEALEAAKEKNQQHRTFADLLKQEQKQNTSQPPAKSQRDDSKQKQNDRSGKKSTQNSPSRQPLVAPTGTKTLIQSNKNSSRSPEKNQSALQNAKKLQIKKEAIPNLQNKVKAENQAAKAPQQSLASWKQSGPSTSSNKASTVQQGVKPQVAAKPQTQAASKLQPAAKPLGLGSNKPTGQAANQPNMNQTMTSLSSNLIKGTVNSQTTTPNLQMSNLPGEKKPQKPSGQSSLVVPKSNNTKSPASKAASLAHSAEPSIYDEDEDLTQRQKLVLDSGRSKGSKKSNDAKSKTNQQNQLKKLEEKGQETTDNYDEYENESGTEKQEKAKTIQKTAEKVKLSSESSKMVDSHAKNSEEYESDFFDENAQAPKTAHDYFKEEEQRKSRNTPAGGNPNSDGGSVFNQTGGQFLSRGQFNQTKSSIYKQENNVASYKRQDSTNVKYSKKNSQNTIIDDQNPPKSDPQLQKQKTKVTNSNKGKQDFLASGLSGVNSTSRYNPYEEAQEGQYAKPLGEYSMSPPLIKAKEQALSGQSSKGSLIQPPQKLQAASHKNSDDRQLGQNAAKFPGQASKDKASFPTKSDPNKSPELLQFGSGKNLTGGAAVNPSNSDLTQKKLSTNQRYTNDDDMLDQSEQYSDEEEFEPATQLGNLPPQPIVPSSRRPALENVEDDDDEYSEDYMHSDDDDDEDLHGRPGLSGAGTTDKKKGSLSKYPIPSSFKEESKEQSDSGDNKGNVKSKDNPTSSATKFKSDAQKKLMTANLNSQSDNSGD